MKTQKLTLDGHYVIRHIRDGRVLSEETIHNTTTTAGFKKVAGLLNQVATGGFRWIALDASSTAATSANTAMATEITSQGLARAAATCTRVTTTNSSDTAQLLKTFTATGTKTVYGAGIFDSSSSGNLAARTTFAAKNMVANDTLAVTYKVKVS